MSDLLNKLGNKNKVSAEGTTNVVSTQSNTNTDPTKLDVSRGTDLINKIGANGSESAAATPSQTSAEVNASTSSKVEPTGNETAVLNDGNTDPSWSLDSAYKEIKKLREENKQYRIKYSEQVDNLKNEMDMRQKAKEAEMQSLIDKAKELDKLKADQEDKKRDLTERLAHRESKLSEYQTMLELQRKEMESKELEYQKKISAYEAERQVEIKVFETRLQEELSKIPEKYKDYANLIAKGAGDPRDALIALNEARIKGLFEDKIIPVNHSVPGAKDGARANKEMLEQGERERRGSMSSKDKIRTALDQMKSQPNSAFRTK